MLQTYLQESAAVMEQTARHISSERFEQAIAAITGPLSSGRPMLICGNGGSASDAMHITGELVGRFLRERRALKAICLSDNAAVLTAWSNDYSFDDVFARQVEAYGEAGAVILGLSTSGNSTNIVRAFQVARSLGMTTIGLTGAGGGKMAEVTDLLLDVPDQRTPFIQQVHICLYHLLCQEIELRLTSG